MRTGLAASLLVLPVAAGLVLPLRGGECCATDACGPTVQRAPITLYQQPGPPPPQWAPEQPIPSPTLFRREVTPPNWAEAPPKPPIKLFTLRPPPVELLVKPPPPVEFFRKETPPPEWVEAPPKPTVTLFRRVPEPLQVGPNVVLPPITLYHQPGPPPACLEECPGAPPLP